MKRIAGLVTIGVVAASLTPSSTIATADPVNWEAVAQCESGGNWSANTGNGDYGGLQISQATWDANGGAEFAGLPSQATPAEQVAVANQIMATQGPAAWPTCASRGGSAAPVGSLTHLLTLLADGGI